MIAFGPAYAFVAGKILNTYALHIMNIISGLDNKLYQQQQQQQQRSHTKHKALHGCIAIMLIIMHTTGASCTNVTQAQTQTQVSI